MALYQRRDSVGRTRFLLALTLSTVTAVGVAAPLAIEALDSDEAMLAAATPETGATALGENSSDRDSAQRSLDADHAGLGGIRSEPGTGDSADAPDASDTDGNVDDPAASSTAELTPTTPPGAPIGPTTSAAAGSSSPHPDLPTTTGPDEESTTTGPNASSTTEDPDSSTSSTTEAPPITNGETSSTTSTSTTTAP